MITKVIDALLIIESLLNDKVRVSAFKNACITHVISLNPVFCANATHTPIHGARDIQSLFEEDDE